MAQRPLHLMELCTMKMDPTTSHMVTVLYIDLLLHTLATGPAHSIQIYQENG